MTTKLYLIPSLLADNKLHTSLPPYIAGTIIPFIQHFFVENIRTARRYLKKLYADINIDKLHFYPIGKHVKTTEYERYIPIIRKYDCGIITESGCPCIADPGAQLVEMAHRCYVKVVPMVGPSSFMLALMASGLNGQRFEFHGYLPIDKTLRNKKIKMMERKVLNDNCTQIFMETPYRNESLWQNIIITCNPTTRVCIAVELTSDKEFIQTKSVKDWEKNGNPDLRKKPVVFLMGQ